MCFWWSISKAECVSTSRRWAFLLPALGSFLCFPAIEDDRPRARPDTPGCLWIGWGGLELQPEGMQIKQKRYQFVRKNSFRFIITNALVVSRLFSQLLKIQKKRAFFKYLAYLCDFFLFEYTAYPFVLFSFKILPACVIFSINILPTSAIVFSSKILPISAIVFSSKTLPTCVVFPAARLSFWFLRA